MRPIKHILRKIEAIKHAMLRSLNGQQASLQVELVNGKDENIECAVNEAEALEFIGKPVTIIQKFENDYIYITGKVASESRVAGNVISIKILRACWMVRKSKGNLTWLDEKFIHDSDNSTIRLAS